MTRYTAISGLLLVCALALAACGDVAPTAVPLTAPTATPALVGTSATNTSAPAAPTDTAAPAATPTTAPAAPTETSPPVAVSLTAQALIDAFKGAGLPIGAVTIYTAETDPNKLLGRPNQYSAKASWHDTRLPAPTDPTKIGTDAGGGLEIYPAPAGALARAEYIAGIGARMPSVAEYDYVRGGVLLRLSKDLTPAQAEEYRAAFDAFPIPDGGPATTPVVK